MPNQRISSLDWGSIRFVPILHNLLEFAQEVRRQFREFRPEVVAVEYPETLMEPILRGVARMPLLSVVSYEEEDGVLTYLVLEPTDGQVEALRLALAEGVPVHFVDRDTADYPYDFRVFPDSYAVRRIGHQAYCDAWLRSDAAAGAVVQEDLLREKTMAYHLQRLSAEGRRVLFVGGLAHLAGVRREIEAPQARVIGRTHRDGVMLAHLHRDSSREILSETPFLAAQYEAARSGGEAEGLDRLEVQARMVRLAGERQWQHARERLSVQQLRVLNRFARNYALLSARLVPNFYQLLVAARGAVDDNFAYEVWEIGSDYPWQSEQPDLPVLRLSGEDLFLDQKRIRFHRRLKQMRRRLVPVPVRRRAREAAPGEWRRSFRGEAICSYPPEDLVIEGYGQYLKKKALEVKTEENVRIEPFTGSMQDGLDVRETVRRWATGRVYVREERPLRGRVGSVVVIFDPDEPGGEGKEAYPWCVTWLGEHDQESDMAFYSTPAGEVMKGPGISLCQHGGFMLTYPPMRVFDIWKDPFFGQARNKPERLLMAAIDYSLEQHVVYVAAEPPSGRCRSVAARLGKTILYLPIGIFSAETLRKMRSFHVLDGHPVRRYAHRYV
ncbi:hypothetical protein [Desulfatiglans anilini]|uniref:hypothetical protein n=1 Tax=Desulfatiglans anilini TaxID=90728 RepID=UPI000425C156|nr:hypothetical protein [Desulfatiglans anilini]